MESIERLANALELSDEIDFLLEKRRKIFSSNYAVGNGDALISLIDSEIDSKSERLEQLGHVPFWLNRVL